MSHELIVVSDLHIKSVNDDRAKLFIKFLRQLQGQGVKQLVLLGDIFDFCFGASRYFREKFAPFGKELTKLSQEGVGVYYVKGNHEFYTHCLEWEGVSFLDSKDFELNQSDGLRVAFSHGDRLHAPWHYHIYCWFMSLWITQFLAKCLPQEALDRVALYISSISRKRSYTKPINHKAIVARLERWLVVQGAQVGIVGHFHVPYHVKDEFGKSRILCLDSWDKPNYLAYKQGTFARFFFKQDRVKEVALNDEYRGSLAQT